MILSVISLLQFSSIDLVNVLICNAIEYRALWSIGKYSIVAPMMEYFQFIVDEV